MGHEFSPHIPCDSGQYFIAQKNVQCDPNERQLLTIAAVVNVTFKQFRYSEMLQFVWGYYHQGFRSLRYYYWDVSKLNSFRYEGFSTVYCNFNVWSENSDLSVWVSPFTPEVWLVSFIIVVVTILVGFLRVLSRLKKIRIEYDLLKALGESVFAICEKFLRQASTCKRLSGWIIVTLYFTSFMFPAQYELYLTANLVVPPRYQELRTLGEFFSNDYTLIYASEEIHNLSIRTELEDEFERQKLGKFPHEKNIITG